MNAPLWILVFQKAFEATHSFCIFYRWRKSTFFLTPTTPLGLRFSQYLNSSATAYFIDGAIFGAVNKHRPVANLSKILEVIWSTTYNLAKKHAHKLIRPYSLESKLKLFFHGIRVLTCYEMNFRHSKTHHFQTCQTKNMWT